MEEIIQFDKQLLLMVNGSDSWFLDCLILTLTNAKTWIPLYLGLFYVVLKSNKNVREVMLILCAAGLCYLLAGAIDDGIVKPFVARWRPTHDPEIGALVDVVNGYRGGNYGFFSAHAANTFSLAVFFSLLMRQRLLTCFLVGWSLINCYTRLYLGVHYPGDITVGLLWGGFVGWFVYWLYGKITTPARYDIRYCCVPVAIIGLTILTAVVMALFGVYY
ncbi:MAG: phosphatase PAP2 family protein [Prevotella sp.]|nr:phosphatase PAP2 family protein [Prevotella sp.]